MGRHIWGVADAAGKAGTPQDGDVKCARLDCIVISALLCEGNLLEIIVLQSCIVFLCNVVLLF